MFNIKIIPPQLNHIFFAWPLYNLPSSRFKRDDLKALQQGQNDQKKPNCTPGMTLTKKLGIGE